MRDTQLTVTLHIGGKQVEKLTDEQIEALSKKVGDVMSTYYTAHQDEYKKIKK